jgi:hypothetical protein
VLNVRSRDERTLPRNPNVAGVPKLHGISNNAPLKGGVKPLRLSGRLDGKEIGLSLFEVPDLLEADHLDDAADRCVTSGRSVIGGYACPTKAGRLLQLPTASMPAGGEVREGSIMGNNLAHQLIANHLVEGEVRRGEEIALKIDQFLLHDGTAPLCARQPAAMGVEQISGDVAVTRSRPRRRRPFGGYETPRRRCSTPASVGLHRRATTS